MDYYYKCICGKNFVATPEWVYKSTHPWRVYCSYGCYRQHRKKRENRPDLVRARERVRRELAGEMPI